MNTLWTSHRRFLLGFLALCILANPLIASAQRTENKKLYREDTREEEKRRKARLEQILGPQAAGSQDLDVKAQEVEFLKEKNALKGTGGILLSRGGVQAQADEGEVQLESKDTTLSGDVLISLRDGSIQSEQAEFNFESETGDFADARLQLEQGAYIADAAKLKKISEFEYLLDDVSLSTCNCADDFRPWVIEAREAKITQEGYAQTYNTTVWVYGVPILYTPYLAFPVKSERASGLLVPKGGYSSTDGVQFEQPLFLALSDSSDLLLTPFIESKTRYGTEFDYRQIFSKYNRLQAGGVYSNERQRDGNLRGTVTDDVYDPEIDDDRFGLYYSQNARSEPESAVPLQLLADGHYVSDNLLLREIDKEELGYRYDRYTTSTALLRASLGSVGIAELGTEYNQALLTDQDLTFQRLPEMSMNFLESFRPFGYNPFGVKTVTKLDLNAVQFARSEGYDGWRYNISPSLEIPFRYQNYFSSALTMRWVNTQYDLDDLQDPGSGLELDETNERNVFSIGYNLGTAFERVYDVDPNGWLGSLASMGARNEGLQLQRVKNVIEPFVRYNLVPDTSQGELPLFDSSDRVRERSLFTYGFKTSLHGRMSPERPGLDPIPELAPHVEDLPSLDIERPLSEFGAPISTVSGGRGGVRQGEIRELAQLLVMQGYDYKIDHEENLGDNPFSDVLTRFTVSPSRYVKVGFESNLDPEESDLSSWSWISGFSDDRGDELRLRYNYVEDSVSQLETNLEVVITDRLRTGLYGRYDELESELIESRAGVRVYGGCDCWYLDVGYQTRTNPDKNIVGLSFTFSGLGDIAQDISRTKQTSNQQ